MGRFTVYNLDELVTDDVKIFFIEFCGETVAARGLIIFHGGYIFDTLVKCDGSFAKVFVIFS